MNDPQNDKPKSEPVTDAEHLLEPKTEEQVNEAVVSDDSTTTPAEPVVQPEPETPVTQLQPVAPVTDSPAPLATPVEAPHSNSGGVLVLQWLTYAFWFWFSVSMSYLAGVVINYYIAGDRSSSTDWGTILAYPLASVLIMLTIALICDKFYSKHEPVKKTGGANVIMLLHVVPFVLIAIGALVTIVFALINMLLDSSPVASMDGPLQIMLVALVVAVLLGLTAVRAFYGNRRKVRLATWLAFAVIAVGFIIAGIAGPASSAMLTKQDRLIEQALPSLSTDIRQYATSNNKLPAKLTDVQHSASYDSEVVQKLIDSNLVTYKPNTLPSVTGNSYSPDVTPNDPYAGISYAPDAPRNGVKRFYYQLCTKYKSEKKSEYNYTDNGRTDYTTDLSAGVASNYKSEYVSSISSHPAGEVCYNLYADGDYAKNGLTVDTMVLPNSR